MNWIELGTVNQMCHRELCCECLIYYYISDDIGFWVGKMVCSVS